LIGDSEREVATELAEETELVQGRRDSKLLASDDTDASVVVLEPVSWRNTAGRVDLVRVCKSAETRGGEGIGSMVNLVTSRPARVKDCGWRMPLMRTWAGGEGRSDFIGIRYSGGGDNRPTRVDKDKLLSLELYRMLLTTIKA
jgi:hypothetical protein